jgi:L-ascorbate metabolism protein UlaG (beta-lactamase superfamily)
MKRVTRRALLTAAAAAAGVSALEWASLSGKLDHTRGPIASARDRFLASSASLGALGAAMVHVAHSTHLLSIAGVRLLTDPWFYDPAFGALSHEVGPAVLPAEIGALDAILVTHDHADHADIRAMDRMDKRAAAIVATSELAAKMRGIGFKDVSVLPPWEERKVGDAVVTAVPGQHDVYEIGFVVRGAGKSVYFAGDSRLHPDIAAIAERFSPDVAILPVDGTRVLGGALHVMTPADAVSAARTLKSTLVVPSHAEAYFSDVLARYVLASTVPHAREAFASLVRRDLPGVRCVLPSAGELVAW